MSFPKKTDCIYLLDLFCGVLICFLLCCSCGVQDYSGVHTTASSYASTDIQEPVKLFDTDYSVSIHSCVDASGRIGLPFLPYGTAPSDLLSLMGVSKETFDATRTDAVQNMDFSNMSFLLFDVPVYLDHVSIDEQSGYFNSVEIIIDYTNISRNNVEDVKNTLLDAIKELAPEKTVMHFSSIDTKTTIYCNVLPLNQYSDSPIGIQSVTFFYNY